MREDRVALPESEQNPPDNKSIGFKPWNDAVERFWTGHQWSDTYKNKEKTDAKTRPDV